MPQAPGAPSPIPSLPNLRDLGGYRGLDGRTVRGAEVFRSTDFSGLAPDDLPGLAKLGLRTVYDLRSTAERDAIPDPTLPDVTDIHLDVLADAGMSIPGNIGAFLSDPDTVAQASAGLSDGKARDMIAGTYREIVSIPSGVNGYRRFYQGLLGEDAGPVLFHCTTGKDRTGWAAASLLTLLGVAKDDVYHDYLLTNERLIPSLKPVFDGFAKAGGDPQLLVPVLGVDAAYLDAAFAEVDEKHGGIEQYFVETLGLGADALSAMREKYLT